MIAFELPIKTKCSLNSRMHWAQRARLVKGERKTARVIALSNIPPPYDAAERRIPSSVKLTRKHVGKPLDDDNLRGYLKGCRDGLADVFGVDDGDARIVWQYAQKKVAKRSDFGVEVEIRYVGEPTEGG